MARIVRATAYGSPEVLELHEIPMPEPTPDGVVIEVRAAGDNPSIGSSAAAVFTPWTTITANTTATHALHAAGVGEGDTVLVHGGSGGVGLTTIQLASARGASVITTASTTNHELLRRLGAVPVTYGGGLLDRVRDVAPDASRSRSTA